MASVCLYFQVHQPFRLRRDYNFFAIGVDHSYEDATRNRAIARQVADRCYLPANRLMLKLLRQHDGAFRVSFSITGLALEQFKLYAPEVIASFQELVATGCVELLGETYYHSLASQFAPAEFRQQVELHAKALDDLFGVRPGVLRNTELIYDDQLALAAEELGYAAVLAEGAPCLLAGRAPGAVYEAGPTKGLKLLLRDHRLSDDLAFRFANRSWRGYPLTAKKLATSIQRAAASAQTVNLFMDYETFGEHHWAESGIFGLLAALPGEVLKASDCCFQTPSEVAAAWPPQGRLDAPGTSSWADLDRDLSAWLGNPMQDSANEAAYQLADAVMATGDEALLHTWRKLLASDHFYYMCVKKSSDGAVHDYFAPFCSPHEAYVIYMNVLNDLAEELKRRHGGAKPKKRAGKKVKARTC